MVLGRSLVVLPRSWAILGRSGVMVLERSWDLGAVLRQSWGGLEATFGGVRVVSDGFGDPWGLGVALGRS